MNLRMIGGLFLLASAFGCAKSPLDPAGAVTVTAPQPSFPPNGAQIASGAQPITLTIRNAATTDPEASVVYTFEVAGDKAFGFKILSKDVGQGSGETSTTLEPLPANQQYYWRARALAGSTLGAYTEPVSFTITSASTSSLQPPAPVTPPNGSIVASTRPTLTVTNSSSASGSPDAFRYFFEVSTDAAFATVAASGAATAGALQTSFTVPSALWLKTTYYWHARTIDVTTGAISGYSTTATFVTPSGS